MIRHYFHVRTITLVNINGFSPDLVCALIFWRSGLGLIRGKFRQFLTELSAHNIYIFSFLDDNLRKCQWIITKLVYQLLTVNLNIIKHILCIMSPHHSGGDILFLVWILSTSASA